MKCCFVLINRFLFFIHPQKARCACGVPVRGGVPCAACRLRLAGSPRAVAVSQRITASEFFGAREYRTVRRVAKELQKKFRVA